MVYNQEKMTPYFHNDVCDGRNSLAYFICAMHRQQAPQPMTKSHFHQNLSSSYNFHSSASSSTSCPLDNPGENCELPKLSPTSMLPLGHWDSLYYALVAEIRQLHQDLINRYGFACEIENPVLHQQGPDGTTDQQITAIDLASMLETAWYALMDHRLVATLDDAVRTRNLCENAARTQVDGAVKQFLTEINNEKSKYPKVGDGEASVWPPPIAEGMIDVNALSPEAIVSLLWEKHAPEINRACLEDFEDEAMLTTYRAELHAKEVEASVAASTPLPTASFCTCHRTCVCSLKCDQDSTQCTCMNGRAQIYHLIRHQEAERHEIHTKYTKPDVNIPNQFLGAATTTLAQMQIAAIANPNPVIVQACNNIHEANDAQLHVATQNRQRSNTNDSSLAYVPLSSAPNRRPKDAYPLGFYGNISPQRYPKMAQQTWTAHSNACKGPGASSLLSTGVRAQKPVLPPITTSVNPYGWIEGPPTRKHILTPSSGASYQAPTFTEPGQVKYPSIPVSRSENLFTQRRSFTDNPMKTVDPRDICDEPAINIRNMQADYIEPAQQYVGLLSRHPSTIERGEQAAEPFLRLSYPSIPNPPQKASTTNHLPTLKTLNAIKEQSQPTPALPQPDFIAPRPAIKQRYVSAGGNAKLSERAEIQGPAYTTPMASTGGAISKEEVELKMNDPQWVKKHFGEAALGVTSTSSPPRLSAESGKRGSGRNSRRISERKSNESDRNKNGDKRDRTSSGASGRVAKLKRVFSRRNSTGEME